MSYRSSSSSLLVPPLLLLSSILLLSFFSCLFMNAFSLFPSLSLFVGISQRQMAVFYISYLTSSSQKERPRPKMPSSIARLHMPYPLAHPHAFWILMVIVLLHFVAICELDNGLNGQFLRTAGVV